MVFGPEGSQPNKDNQDKERQKYLSVEQMFIDLSDPATVHLVTPERLDLLRPIMHEELLYSGMNFELIDNPEMRANLNERQFRYLSAGKGLAVAAAMDGQSPPVNITACTHMLAYRLWAQIESNDLPKLDGGEEFTRRRGLEQLLANTVAFVAGAQTSETYLKDLHWRLGAYYEKPLKEKTEHAQGDERSLYKQQLQQIRQAYNIPAPKQPERSDYTGYSRIKPDSVRKFWTELKSNLMAEREALVDSILSLDRDQTRNILGHDSNPFITGFQ